MVNPESNSDLTQSQNRTQSDSRQAAEALAGNEEVGQQQLAGDETDEGTPLVDIKQSGGGGGGGDKDAEAEDAEESTAKKPKLDVEFRSLTKEELDAFAKNPFWRKLRLILFILFWLVWAAMLAAVIIIIVVSPRCPPRPARQFWQKPFYRLSVKSFAPSSDADPTAPGSVAGLAKKMDYLRATLGFDNFILDSLITREPTSGCPTDFRTFNSSLMSLESLKALTKLGRKKGFSFLMEFDASQGDLAVWNSSAFVTTDVSMAPLASRNGGPAWRDSRLHLPRSGCPSLKVTDPQVAEKIEAALNFWLDAGLSGFVLTNVAFMLPTSAPPAATPPGLNGRRWLDADPTPLLFSNASEEFVRRVRQFVNVQAEKRGRELALFVEPGNTGFPQPADRLAAYLDRKDGAHAVISTALGNSLMSPPAARPTSPSKLILDILDAAGSNGSVMFASAWSHLRRPSESHLTAMSLLLPGVPCLYYGQELGMAHVTGVRLQGDGLSSYLAGNESTDPSETPMQWSGSAANAGWLSNATTRLSWVDLSPRAGDIEQHNLRRLSSEGHPASQLQLVQSLVKLVGSSESLQWGGIEFLRSGVDSVVAFKREAERFPPVLVVMNTGDKVVTIGLKDLSKVSTGTLKVLHNVESSSSYKKDEDYSLDVVFVPAKSILVFLGKIESA